MTSLKRKNHSGAKARNLNPLMHERNPYRQPPNFKKLAVEFEDFRKVVKQSLSGKIELDFRDREASRILTQTLLKKDFQLNVVIPKDTLVPTLPLRMNYLLWIEDILLLNKIAKADVQGLDIGVGASCIYPLLAFKHFGWKMIGTETCQDNFDAAKANLSTNEINEENIHLFHTDGKFFDILNNDRRVTFTMCNPPFYDESHKTSDSSPGQDQELRTKGGEVEYVTKMIEESKGVSEKVKVFSSMLGHQSSMKPLKGVLNGIPKVQFTFTEFCQGKTMRWGVAWTFSDDVKLSDTSPLKQKKQQEKKKKPMSFEITSHRDVEAALKTITEWLDAIDCEVSVQKSEENEVYAKVKTFQTNWKNQRRKRREEERKADEESNDEPAAKSAKMDAAVLQLECTLFLHKVENVVLEMAFVDGLTGREGLHQLAQFIKNKFGALKPV